jgi:hypothetical protein
MLLILSTTLKRTVSILQAPWVRRGKSWNHCLARRTNGDNLDRYDSIGHRAQNEFSSCLDVQVNSNGQKGCFTAVGDADEQAAKTVKEYLHCCVALDCLLSTTSFCACSGQWAEGMVF